MAHRLRNGKTAIENEQNLIIEGCYVSVNWREGLLGYLDQVVLRALIPTQDYPVHHFADLKRHAHVIEYRIDDTSFTADEGACKFTPLGRNETRRGPRRDYSAEWLSSLRGTHRADGERYQRLQKVIIFGVRNEITCLVQQG